MRAFGRFCGRLLLWVRDRAEEDIGRLQEAGVRLVETRAELATAESRLKIGEAAEKHAAAEERRAASEERRAHARKTNAEARKQEIENKLTEATALARLEDVISKIRQNGGDVRFSEEQLRLLASLSDGGGGEGPATNAE
ncbi:MAG: hypothetical protein CMJ31_13235 [Phycisphaerae bacterium]|nr:hypothetical protein [Phycisphaerae bacterium]